MRRQYDAAKVLGMKEKDIKEIFGSEEINLFELESINLNLLDYRWNERSV